MGIEYYICDEKNKRAFELGKGFGQFFKGVLPGTSIQAPVIAEWLVTWWNNSGNVNRNESAVSPFWRDLAIQIWAFCQTAQWQVVIKDDCAHVDELDEYRCVYTRFDDKSDCLPDPCAEEHAKWVKEAERVMQVSRLVDLADLAALREAVELADKYVGCGDSACMFVRPKGMATNGGCQCVGRGNHKPGVPLALAKVYKAAKKLVSE